MNWDALRSALKIELGNARSALKIALGNALEDELGCIKEECISECKECIED